MPGLRSADAAADSYRSISPSRADVRLVRLVGALGFLLAVLILLGWALDLTLLKSGLPGERATQPLTAACFALCALSLGLSTERCVLCRFFTRGAALFVLGVVLATVCQNALDIDWGLDRLLFADAVVHEQTGSYLRAGRPAAGTLVALGLLSCTLLLIRTRSSAARSLFVWLATAGTLFSGAVLLAYLYGLQALYAMGFYAQVGLNTSIALLLLFAGVLVRRADWGWMRLLAGAGAGAASARGLLRWSGSVVLTLAIIVRLGQSRTPSGATFELALLTMGGLGLLLAALVTHARRLDALETIRHSLTTDLRAEQARLVRSAHAKDQQLARFAHELRNPLTPLRNGIEIVRHVARSNALLGRTADMMSRQIVRLVRLADDLVGIKETATVDTNTMAPVTGLPRLKILVADDNADGAESLAMLLQTHGHVVLTASDGVRALEVAEAFRPDVILMDLSMPNMDGVEATKAIRARPWGAAMRIIALTAWGQESERKRTREAGMDLHLVKPVDPVELEAILHK